MLPIFSSLTRRASQLTQPYLKGFNERRLQILEAFWRSTRGGSQTPRNQWSHLFDVFRLLLPHNDDRRYYWGTTGMAKAFGLALGLEKDRVRPSHVLTTRNDD